MKKFMKGAAAAGGFCLLFGLVIIFVGVLGGGVKNFRKNYIDIIRSEEGAKISKVLGVFDHISLGDGISLGFINDNSQIFDNDYEKYPEGSYEIRDIEAVKLEIQVGAGKLDVKYYDGDCVKLEVGEHDQMQCFVEKNTLKIIGGLKFDVLDTDSDMTVYLPEKNSYDKIFVKVGAGNLTIEKLCGKDVAVDVGMGNVILSGLNAENMDANVGMGNLAIEGSLTGDATVDCGMGQIVMELSGNGKDFDYELDCGIGSLKVEGVYSIVGIGNKNIDNGATKEIDATVVMGNIEVKFKE